MHYGQQRPTVAIRSFAPYRHDQLSELAELCGCTVAPEHAAADYLFADLCSVTDGTKEEWSEIADYLHQYGAQALVWIGTDQIDAAYGELPPERCEFLIDADDALAVPIMARANRRANMDQLHDNSRDGEYRDLHRMSGELADFARTLARIAEQEGEAPSAVYEKPVSFRAAPSGLFEPLGQTAMPTTDAVKVRNLIKLRRLREQHFPADLFADPGWDILLDLYAAKLEGKSVSVSSLCIAAAVPPTTGLRWITSMTEHGALVRRHDPNDARRVFIELSEDSEERLRRFFKDAEAKGGLPI
jgi:DNA-binding MarR family transcriptional regulator